MADPERKGCELGGRTAQQHQSLRGDRSREGSGITAMVLPGTENISPVPVPCSLNHTTRRGRRYRAGQEVPSLPKGRRVGAAQVPARTHSVPTPASSPSANILKECESTSRREAKQDGGPRGFPEKLPKNADFLWTGLPLWSIVKLGSKIQNSDLNEYKSADIQNQFRLHQNQNREERYTFATGRADQSHASTPRASARGQPVAGP